MENFIRIRGCDIPLTDDQVAEIASAFVTSVSEQTEGIKISDDGCFVIGEHEFIVLERGEGTVIGLLKTPLEGCTFGDNNNYAGSHLDEICNEIADEIVSIIGDGSLVTFELDLTSNDGLKDYGTVSRRASPLTAEMARRYVEVLDRHKVSDWWWLSTPYSTPTHDNSTGVLCVSPSGTVSYNNGLYFDFGVRPFCIFKSSIFVSEKE